VADLNVHEKECCFSASRPQSPDRTTSDRTFGETAARRSFFFALKDQEVKPLMSVHVAAHESAFGTSRHFAALQNLSAIGVTADMPNGFSKVKS
jgi:hypothetical protein